MSTSSSPEPSRLHPLTWNGLEAPRQFTYPYCYTPHPLCLRAACELKAEIARHPDWTEEIAQGKMMGVLVVEGGFLAAFSGTLGGRGLQPYFVPPVFDLHEPDCFFQQEEREISLINQRITSLEQSPERLTAIREIQKIRDKATKEIAEARQRMTDAKQKRDERRARGEWGETMIRESQYLKAELRRTRQRWEDILHELTLRHATLEEDILRLKEERANRSALLQQWLFHSFSFLNANGESRPLCEIFGSITPPAGAGECCAPKLLQYAYAHHLHPLCMAEFWMGVSPKDELRLEGNFYPACQAKCKPILTWMLQGLDVEPNPMTAQYNDLITQLRILHHDQDIVVLSKPAGMLSVPGKEDLPSVKTEMQKRFPQATGPLIVHRLDMDTSGLMVIALTTEAYHHLQQQFAHHTIVKRYLAEVEKPLEGNKQGAICLPLIVNPSDRPRQMVCHSHGKQAVTRYQVIGPHSLLLWPETGRTHQLRVHLAHPEGLNNPIIGDRLYGHPSHRLHLHADLLQFYHPRTGERLTFEDEITHF